MRATYPKMTLFTPLRPLLLQETKVPKVQSKPALASSTRNLWKSSLTLDVTQCLWHDVFWNLLVSQVPQKLCALPRHCTTDALWPRQHYSALTTLVALHWWLFSMTHHTMYSLVKFQGHTSSVRIPLRPYAAAPSSHSNWLKLGVSRHSPLTHCRRVRTCILEVVPQSSPHQGGILTIGVNLPYLRLRPSTHEENRALGEDIGVSNKVNNATNTHCVLTVKTVCLTYRLESQKSVALSLYPPVATVVTTFPPRELSRDESASRVFVLLHGIHILSYTFLNSYMV